VAALTYLNYEWYYLTIDTTD